VSDLFQTHLVLLIRMFPLLCSLVAENPGVSKICAHLATSSIDAKHHLQIKLHGAALVLGNRREVNSGSIFDKLAPSNCRARSANKLSTNDSSVLMSSGVSSWFRKVQPSAGCLWIEPRPERNALAPSERDTCPRMRPRGRPLPRARRRPELRSR
jgi:hypothetical protein